MQEEDQLRVEDTNEEALASKMYILAHLVQPLRKVILLITMRNSLRSIEAKEILLYIEVIGQGFILLENL